MKITGLVGLQATFPKMQVSRDTDSEIHTTLRGRRYATSIEGTLTGRGGNLVIIDDPLKLNDAHSETARARSIEWYRSTLVTRPDDKMAARIVVVMQRVHEDDLVGYLLERGSSPKATCSRAGPFFFREARLGSTIS